MQEKTLWIQDAFMHDFLHFMHFFYFVQNMV